MMERFREMQIAKLRSSRSRTSKPDRPDRSFEPTIQVLTTLVVLYGVPVSLKLSYPRIYSHIVQPNLPAHVVFSLDINEAYDVGNTSNLCIQNLGVPVDVLNSSTCISAVSVARDSCLINRAVKYVSSTYPTSYGHLIAVRTNQAFKINVRVAETFAAHPSFFRSFITFENNLVLNYQQKKKSNATPSYHERILCWLMCGGLSPAIPSFVAPQKVKGNTIPVAPWPYRILNERVRKLSDDLHYRSEKGNYVTYQAAVVKAVKQLLSDISVVYYGGSAAQKHLVYGPFHSAHDFIRRMGVDTGAVLQNSSSVMNSIDSISRDDAARTIAIELQGIENIAESISADVANATTTTRTLQAATAPVKPTLIIIYGDYRTFDITCPSIFDNIVQPNLPARVVLSIDSDKDFELGIPAKQCIQPFNSTVEVLRVRPSCPGRQLKEFCLAEEALKHVEGGVGYTNATYGYIVKVRTDNYVNEAIHVAAIYGAHPSFFERYQLFERSLLREYRDREHREPSFHERLWGWIFCGGLSRMIVPMLFKYNGAVWSRVDAVQWNKNIRDFISATSIFNFSIADPCTPFYSPSRVAYEDAVLKTILKVTSSFKVVYLIGSTWVHFGPFDLVREESRDILRLYGSLTWDTGPQEGHDSWRDIHESQVRLVHRVKGWNLIGLENKADFNESFDQYQTVGVIDEMVDPNLLVWILRTCSSHRNRREC